MEQQNIINKIGGTRKGSGAKPKYNEKTTTIAFRVPISKINDIKHLIKNYLLCYKTSLT